MIEAIMAVTLLILIIAFLLLLSQKTDNTNWLALKAYAEARLVHYDGKDKEHITALVTEFGFCCEEIVKCTTFSDAKHRQRIANHATAITKQLHTFGFFEKTKDVALNLDDATVKEITHRLKGLQEQGRL